MIEIKLTASGQSEDLVCLETWAISDEGCSLQDKSCVSVQDSA